MWPKLRKASCVQWSQKWLLKVTSELRRDVREKPGGVEDSETCRVMVTGPQPGTVAIPSKC